MDQNDLVSFQMMAMPTSNSNDLFTWCEMEEWARQSVDPTVGIQDVLGIMQKHTNIIQNFDQLHIRNH